MPQNPKSGDGIDTGPGGFDIDGDLFTVDTSTDEKIPFGGAGTRKKTIDVNKSFVDENGKPRDVGAPVRLTLAKYLSDVTMGKAGSAKVPNRYPVSPPEIPSPGKTQNISDADGNPTGPTPVPYASNNFYSTDVDPYSPEYPAIKPQIRKGKSAAAFDATDGNDLLRKNEGKPVEAVKTYQSAVLSRNRFAPAGLYNETRFLTNEGDAKFNPELTKQETQGRYEPNASTVNFARLASIGPLLTMRASNELGATSPEADPNSAGSQAASILPGKGQLGIERINQEVLLASDVLKDLTTNELSDSSIISPGSLSWGSLNNVNDPFSGTDAVGMLTLSTALLIGLEVVIDSLSVMLGAITPSNKVPSHDVQGRRTLGEYLPASKKSQASARGGLGGMISAVASLNFGGLLGIRATNYPFNRALTTGLNAFFGIADSQRGGIGLNQLVGALASSADSPGFNVVVARSIIRSSLTIIDQTKRINGNVVNGITQTLALVDVIRDSKIVAACNVFASLGDAILSSPDASIDKASNALKVSTMDSRADVVGGSVGKNRLKGSLKLAWASNTAPANMLLPASVLGTSIALGPKNMGQFSPFLGVKQDAYSQVRSTVTTKEDGGRIPTEIALEFEKKLEASYVPFYFHDLRTNEMVSFHAFLASLTDDYTAAYEKPEGIGRVEPVRIYKSTERRINMSFYVIATSLLDFDEMYVKINKLVTLLYPQYTAGLTLQDKSKGPSELDWEGSYRFTQPFSQLAGASPLIRLRLGDLLRSNYSLYALGRLFGMNNPGFTVDGLSFTGENAIDQDVLNNISQKIQEALGLGPSQGAPSGGTYIPAPAFYPQYVDAKSSNGIGIPTPKIPGVTSGNGPKFAPQFQAGTDKIQPFLVRVKGLHPDNPFMVLGEVIFNDDLGHSDKFSPGLKAQVEELYNNEEIPLWRYIGGTYVFPISSLTPTDKTMSETVAKLSALSNLGVQNDRFMTAFADFMNPAKNAIVKSFRDAGGKGLAGVIESMNFDWFDKVTWETERGRIAPKICKVTIGFSPIHDISPGIDHHGFNRAPVYPVGVMGQKE